MDRALQEHELCVLCSYLGENLVHVTFTEEDVAAMEADFAAVCEHVHKLMFVGKIVTPHRIMQLNGLGRRVQENLAAWRE